MVLNDDVETDPWRQPDNRISVGFRIHDGYSSPLLNLQGSDPDRVKRDIVITTGVVIEDVDSETVLSILAKAHEQARAVYLASEILGATVDSVKKTSGTNWGNRNAAKPAAQPDSVGRKEKPANPEDGVVEEIKAAATRGDLNKIFAKNSTGNLKVNGGWKTEAQCAAATERFKELAAK